MLFEGDPDPTPPEGMVNVARFESPVEAQMVKGLLESFGLECFLAGENANSLMQSAFRTRLQVRQPDEATARDLLTGGTFDEPA